MHENSFIGSLKGLWSIKEELKLKVFYLSFTFLLMMGCLVLWRPLKMAIFSKMVGAQFIPEAKLYFMLILIPLILLYSKMVDWLRRHQLLYCFTLFHAVGGIIFYFFLSHHGYGIANTQTSSSRVLGWLFYFFMESFDAFFATTFWSFADSVNNLKDAKNYYGFFVSGSKVGGIVAAGTFYLVITYFPSFMLSGSLLCGSLFLLGAAYCIHSLIKNVPDDYMHGYKATYKLETAHKLDRKQSWSEWLCSPIEGLIIIAKNPYVLGIFSLIIFYEVVNVIFDYRVALEADSLNKTVEGMTAYYAIYYFLINVFGLVISMFGTTPILRRVGFRSALFIFPLLCMFLVAVSIIFPVAGMVFCVSIGLRSFNYAFNHPTREVLYIPTTKDIKFKAKAWSDAFGTRIAKSFGSLFNVAMKGAAPSFILISSVGLSLGLTSLWLIVVYFLGRTLQDAIDNKKVIGQSDQSSNQDLNASL